MKTTIWHWSKIYVTLANWTEWLTFCRNGWLISDRFSNQQYKFSIKPKKSERVRPCSKGSVYLLGSTISRCCWFEGRGPEYELSRPFMQPEIISVGVGYTKTGGNEPVGVLEPEKTRLTQTHILYADTHTNTCTNSLWAQGNFDASKSYW